LRKRNIVAEKKQIRRAAARRAGRAEGRAGRCAPCLKNAQLLNKSDAGTKKGKRRAGAAACR
jgi:hypothetical protein